MQSHVVPAIVSSAPCGGPIPRGISRGLAWFGSLCVALLGAVPALADAWTIVEVWPDGPAPFVELRANEVTQSEGLFLRFESVDAVPTIEAVDVGLPALTWGRGARWTLAVASDAAFEATWGRMPDFALEEPVAFVPRAGRVSLGRWEDETSWVEIDAFEWGTPAGAFLDNLTRRGAALDETEGAETTGAWGITGVGTPGAPNDGVLGLFVVEGTVRGAGFATDAAVEVRRDGAVLSRVSVAQSRFRSGGLAASAEPVNVVLLGAGGARFEQAATVLERNARVDFLLDREASLALRFDTPGGDARALIVELEGPTRVRQVVETDTWNAFDGLNAGTWRLRAEAFGFETVERTLFLDGETEWMETLVPRAQALLRVRAVLRSGAAATTAEVRVEGRGARGIDAPRVAVVGQDGWVEFDALPVGAYRVLATYQGGTTRIEEVVLDDDASLVVQVLPQNFAPPYTIERGCGAAPHRGTGGALVALFFVGLCLRRRR